MFTVYQDKIEEHKDFFNGTVPQKVRANERDFYGRSNKIFRHIEDHLNRHLKLIANTVYNFIKGKNINFILIGGHKEMLSKIKNHLPKTLKKMIRGEFVTELNIPLKDIYLKSKQSL